MTAAPAAKNASHLGVVLDERQITKAVARLAREIVERHHDLDSVVLAGVRTRGAPLARRLAATLPQIAGAPMASVVELDVRDFRDDRPRPKVPPGAALRPLDGGPVPGMDDATVVVVDDVFFTGRTFRAALDALTHSGRPAVVELLALVDRGHREVPLRATYVGKNIPTSMDVRVVVHLTEIDGEDVVRIVPTARATALPSQLLTPSQLSTPSPMRSSMPVPDSAPLPMPSERTP